MRFNVSELHRALYEGRSSAALQIIRLILTSWSCLRLLADYREVVCRRLNVIISAHSRTQKERERKHIRVVRFCRTITQLPAKLLLSNAELEFIFKALGKRKHF